MRSSRSGARRSIHGSTRSSARSTEFGLRVLVCHINQNALDRLDYQRLRNRRRGGEEPMLFKTSFIYSKSSIHIVMASGTGRHGKATESGQTQLAPDLTTKQLGCHHNKIRVREVSPSIEYGIWRLQILMRSQCNDTRIARPRKSFLHLWMSRRWYHEKFCPRQESHPGCQRTACPFKWSSGPENPTVPPNGFSSS